jgi:two-component system NarL family response regulator
VANDKTANGKDEPLNPQRLRILLVDDHQIFREALRGLLERMPNLEVVGEAGDGAHVLPLAQELSPDIVCMDIGMPGLNGIDTTRQLCALLPEIKVIALSTHTDHVYVVDMIYAGAVGYVSKSEGGKELLRAIDAVAHNRQYLSAAVTDVITQTLLKHKAPTDTASLLGKRERQVLCLVAQGLSSQQIANQLAIAASTVDVHRRNIMRKLDLHSAVDLTRYAINTGLLAD